MIHIYKQKQGLNLHIDIEYLDPLYLNLFTKI